MKYKIVVGGRGSECYVHSINENQKLKLSECGIDGSYGEHETITEILDKEDIFDTDNIFLGPYNYPENYIIEVFNENNVKVWSSDTNHEFKDDEYESAMKQIDKFKDQLKKYRSTGLEKDGEYSYENLVFKFLRRNGYIEKLFNFKNKLMDKNLSLENQDIE